eukprot:2756987-Rhodomonas_salina.3
MRVQACLCVAEAEREERGEEESGGAGVLHQQRACTWRLAARVPPPFQPPPPCQQRARGGRGRRRYLARLEGRDSSSAASARSSSLASSSSFRFFTCHPQPPPLSAHFACPKCKACMQKSTGNDGGSCEVPGSLRLIWSLPQPGGISDRSGKTRLCARGHILQLFLQLAAVLLWLPWHHDALSQFWPFAERMAGS